MYCQSSICQSHHNQDCVQVLVYDRIQEGIQSFCANNSIDEVYNTKFLLIEGYVKEQLNASIAKVDMPFLSATQKFISAPPYFEINQSLSNWLPIVILFSPLDIFAPHQNFNIFARYAHTEKVDATPALNPWSLQKKFVFSLLMTLSQSGTFLSRSQTFHRRLLRTTGRY